MYRKSILALCLALGAAAAGGVTAVSAQSAEVGSAPPPPAVATDPPGDCKLPNRNFLSLGLPANWNNFPRPAGEMKVALLFRNYSAAGARDQYNQFRPAETWWATSSYGRYSLKLVPHFPAAVLSGAAARHVDRMARDDAGMVGDVRVPPKHGSGVTQAATTWATVARSVDSVFDFSTIDIVVVVDANGGRSHAEFEPNFVIDGHRIKSGVVLGPDWPGYRDLLLSHEVGHAISLPDEYGGGGPGFEYTGGWGIMGNLGGPSPDLFAYEKWHQEWLADNQIACVRRQNSGTDQTITPLETTGGTKAVVVRHSDTVAYIAEVRTNKGVNAKTCSTGVLVYRVDSAGESGAGPVRVIDSRPGSGGCGSIRHELNDAVYGVNQTFNDTANRVRIQVLSKDGDNYVVRASLGTYTPDPTTPGPTTPGPTTPGPTTPGPTTPGPTPTSGNEVLFSDDFESAKGWTVNPSGSDTATAGRFEVADPEATTFNGLTFQRGETPSGARDLVTGALAGPDAGTHDVDGGVTSIRSPEITLPSSGPLGLSFKQYLAHANNATSADYLRVKVNDTVVFEQKGAPVERAGAWAEARADLVPFAGQRVRITVQAADADIPSMIEAGVDDVLVTGPGESDPPALFGDNFEGPDGDWTVNAGGTDTATTGAWARGNPAETSYQSIICQRDNTPSGSNALVTGIVGGVDCAQSDVDGGVTSVTSGEITLGTSRCTLSLTYYLAHLGNATADDYLRVTVGGTEVFRRVAGPSDVSAVWQDATVDLSAFAGQTIRITIEAADKGTPSLVEAAVDDVTVRKA